jgi:dihydroorotate dehydrogenase
MNIYKNVIRPILFKFPSEVIHHKVLSFASIISIIPIANITIKSICNINDKKLQSLHFGLTFKNPIGLAAGFDKDAKIVSFCSALGFGFLELGTVTPLPQLGNSGERLFRIPEHNALINRLGFPSNGIEEILPRLKLSRSHEKKIALNIGKQKLTSLEDVVGDYINIFHKAASFVDMITINVSSPNTPDLRRLQEKDKLNELLQGLQEANYILKKPLLLKLSPDLSFTALDDALEVALENNIAGIVAVNTTLSRNGITGPEGGLSGKPLNPLALKVVTHIYSKVGSKIPVIGVGGISSGIDAINMIKAGASLVQLYTALIYEGPFVIKKINQEILNYLNQHNIDNITNLIGVNHV